MGDVSADPSASLAVTFSGPGPLLVDVVSLLPAENVARAAAAGAMNPWPFRADLLQMLKDLQPRCSHCSTASICTAAPDVQVGLCNAAVAQAPRCSHAGAAQRRLGSWLQVHQVPGRLLCGGRHPGARIPVEDGCGAVGGAAGPLEPVGLLEHRW